MKQILIHYTSETGNTDQIANLLKQHLEKRGFAITMKQIGLEDIVNISELHQFDGILFGTYTYFDGELPFEIEVYYDFLEEIDLTGTVVGVFGSGDTSYALFCHAVDLMKKQFEQTHATVINHTVKVDLYPEDEETLAAIKKLADQFEDALIHSLPVGNPC
ncbi:flavodoxin domain-containing protein [Paenisporosarcina antarctica]|uniref:Flavodoxin n=1 Tax=Paenisporosarcina antarctica TaxID=417367 RepID=A0A4V1ANF7_9BACL|nr:flavodoxin domain-containing protein [Paenisporosarcina antarctica]QBP42615.1 flavodoxin [Paenisporosarcina antarctica]